jgi:hypothetical protein
MDSLKLLKAQQQALLDEIQKTPVDRESTQRLLLDILATLNYLVGELIDQVEELNHEIHFSRSTRSNGSPKD